MRLATLTKLGRQVQPNPDLQQSLAKQAKMLELGKKLGHKVLLLV